MAKPLDETYLTWLYSKVANVRERVPSRTYWNLLRELYKKEFVWIIPNDDNRIEDGKELRWEFLREANLNESDSTEWLSLGCSVLELLIALSRRAAFETDDPASYWFWIMVSNLGLGKVSDANPKPEGAIDHILDNFIWRTYNTDGWGGLFPLIEPSEDQRQVELWYQLNAYLLERE